MKIHKHGPLILLKAAIPTLAALCTLSCDAFNFPLERFFIENIATVSSAELRIIATPQRGMMPGKRRAVIEGIWYEQWKGR
jgi:hypothetical protein